MLKKKEVEKKEKNEKSENNIEIIIGDNSNLNISDVGDCMNGLRPKTNTNKKKVVIPKIKK